MASQSSAQPLVPVDGNSTSLIDRRQDPWLQKLVLSFDGGGIRGFWSLLILQRLMKEVEKTEFENDKKISSSFHPCHEPLNVSQLARTGYTRYLPCHYFDYIGGTSTGALIAILLSRFRMTVEDCIHEYKTMAQLIFGNPRRLHKMNIYFLTPKNKYRVKLLDQAIKEVIDRRKENTAGVDGDILFSTEIDTCCGIVLAIEVKDGKVIEQRFIFRSYTAFEERTPRSDQNEVPGMRNPDLGTKMSVWRVARAVTAAPLYFGHYIMPLSTSQVLMTRRIPTRMTSFLNNWHKPKDFKEKNYLHEFVDAGFSSANNPCEEILDELQHLHANNLSREEAKPVMVSIGTARPRTRSVRDSFLSTIHRSFDQLGDPEENHARMQRAEARGDCSYYRFNDSEGLDVQMDEWLPRKNGKDTLRKLEAAFDTWVRSEGIEEKMKKCAKRLVHLRQARVKKSISQWERFSLGQYFVCRIKNCRKSRDMEWIYREDFESHVRTEHPEERDIESAVNQNQRIWEYRPAPHSAA